MLTPARSTRALLALAAVGVVALSGCKKEGSEGEGAGPERDARFISDVYTWECASIDSGGKQDIWQGVFGQSMYLQYAPDALGALSLPAAGACSQSLDMFPTGAGASGADIPGSSGFPRWQTDVDSGEMDELADGFWMDDVSGRVHSCQLVDDLLGSGAELTSAGDLTGAVTPSPTEVPTVTFEHPDGDDSTIAWGEELVASWESSSWDSVWVQIRREREGEAWESVTCNVTGEDSFEMSEQMWALFDENLNIETNNLYIAFQNSDEQVLDSGLKVEVVTRSIAVAIVQE